eukprot:gnl/TRDRNA2_/TRDRNA2_192881_c0_seq1.p1 gnl/TRDRNA2_/TRDRNA2_192881_c0~~gnl/TRDRNA2_/TRDRNA2_192881_c0_seq1.p1  ORF type:complete len:301 (-),score=88.59 gnl/TRDRNA2_/TRDRNA2_192881_c0_seq1:70-972(-)
MGKKAKQKVGDGIATKWYVGGCIVLIVAMSAWSFMRQSGKKKRKEKAVEPPPEEEIDERLAFVRDALIGEDGKMLFGKDGAGKKRSSRFADHDYWEERYKKSSKDYDWYGTWNSASAVTIKPHVQDLLPPSPVGPVLNIGCGSSRLAEELHADGFGDIVNVDISHAVVDKMAKKFTGVSGVKFQQMDITKMTFADASFDIVFDKGTLDALYTGDPNLVKSTVAEVYRVVRAGGAFVSVSFGQPRTRTELNSTDPADGAQAGRGWSRFKTTMVEKVYKDEQAGTVVPDNAQEHFYIYVMVK